MQERDITAFLDKNAAESTTPAAATSSSSSSSSNTSNMIFVPEYSKIFRDAGALKIFFDSRNEERAAMQRKIDSARTVIAEQNRVMNNKVELVRSVVAATGFSRSKEPSTADEIAQVLHEILRLAGSGPEFSLHHQVLCWVFHEVTGKGVASFGCGHASNIITQNGMFQSAGMIDSIYNPNQQQQQQQNNQQ